MRLTSGTTVASYIASFPAPTRAILKKIRAELRLAAPNATEVISYGIPTLKLKSNLVHYAAYKTHIGFYPGATGIAAFKTELAKYKTSRGTVQFPIDSKIPYGLLKKITRYQVKQQKER